MTDSKRIGRRTAKGSAGSRSVPGRVMSTDRAYAEFKRRVLDNEMPAGYQILEQELAAMLRMSRTPVREAKVRLVDEGMVEIRPRHGMRVLPVSVDDMREIYEILSSLEPTAAELVARRGLSDSHMADLRHAVADMNAALESDDLLRWATADERFHLLLVELSGNRRLRALVGTFWDQAHRVRMATLRLRPRPTASNTDHAAVVDAIAQRDPEAARHIHHEHRLRSGRMLVELLERYGINQL